MNEYSLLLEVRTFKNPAVSVGVATGDLLTFLARRPSRLLETAV
jgi:hypothetical protein